MTNCERHDFARDDPALFFAKNLMPKSPATLEIGSFTGRHALALQRRYPQGQIIIYEAGRDNFVKLTRAVAGSRVIARNQAVIGSNGNVTFHEFADMPSSNSIMHRPDMKCEIAQSYVVQGVSLEQVLYDNEISRLDALFSNCEGAEIQLMEELIAKPDIWGRVTQACVSFHSRIYGWTPIERILKAMASRAEIIFDVDNKWPCYLFINSDYKTL